MRAGSAAARPSSEILLEGMNWHPYLWVGQPHWWGAGQGVRGRGVAPKHAAVRCAAMLASAPLCAQAQDSPCAQPWAENVAKRHQ